MSAGFAGGRAREAQLYRDERPAHVPLDKPPFGDPPRASTCACCGLWYPWHAFYRPKSKGGRYRRCPNCRPKTRRRR